MTCGICVRGRRDRHGVIAITVVVLEFDGSRNGRGESGGEEDVGGEEEGEDPHGGSGC